MSHARVTDLLHLVVAELKTEAVKQKLGHQLHNKEIAALIGEPANTLSTWMTGGSTNRQFAALLGMLDYLPEGKAIELIRFSLKAKSLKQDLDEIASEQKRKKKSPKVLSPEETGSIVKFKKSA